MKKLLLLVLTLGMFSFYSCSDDNGPELEITAPANGTVFAPGDVITIDATVTDDMAVSSVVLEGQDDLVFSESVDLSTVSDLSNINLSLGITLPQDIAVGDYTIEITATDNDGNTDSEDFEFTVQ